MSGQVLPVEVLARIDEITAAAVWSRLARPTSDRSTRPAVETLGTARALILLALADETEGFGRRAPSVAAIAGKIGVSANTAAMHCRVLARLGWLIRTTGASRRTYYALNPTAILGRRIVDVPLPAGEEDGPG